jgi:hypothetical protein
MKTTKRKLLERIMALEDALGYVWVTDIDGYGYYKQVKDSYGDMTRAQDDIKELKDAKGKK